MRTKRLENTADIVRFSLCNNRQILDRQVMTPGAGSLKGFGGVTRYGNIRGFICYAISCCSRE